MKKRIISFVLLFCLIAAVVGWRHRYISVNKELQSAPVREYCLGEEVLMEEDVLMDFSMKGYSITVNQAEVMTYEKFLEKYHGEDIYSYAPEKVCDVQVTIRNIDAEDSTGINLIDFYLQGLAVCASIEANLYDLANPQVEGVYAIALRKDSEMEFHLPFGLWKDNFRTKIWDDLENFPMDFVATLYPVKKIVHLYQ